jgi:predicted ferric reductase
VKPLFVTLAAVFVITFLGAPAMGGGWFWDAGNGIGFAAFAGLLYLAITSNQRLDVRAHQVLAYAVLALVVAHAFWFLLGDATAVEFIKIGAPDYMWLGIVSLLLFTVLIMIAGLPDRLRIHKDYPSFRYWHRVLTVVVIAGAAYHIIASNFYLGTWYQAMLFAVVSLVACLGREYWVRIGQINIASPVVYLALSSALIIVFAGLRNFPT